MPPPLRFTVNDAPAVWDGDPDASLLGYLRNVLGLTSVKDGCSGQGVCGACLVEMNGKAALACSVPLRRAEGARILTLDGFPEALRRTLAQAFLNRGAVQCGFCTPGLITRAAILLQTGPAPTREDAVRAVRPHVCRCTGYLPLVDALLDAAAALREGRDIAPDTRPGAGSAWPKYGGLERALGTRPFVDDLRVPGLLHGALVFSAHPRARVLGINADRAAAMPGVARVFSAADIPGRPVTGMFIKDWPVFVPVGGVTRYEGDVLACVVADSPERARAAAGVVRVEYDVLPCLADAASALRQSGLSPEAGPVFIVPGARDNVLLDKAIKRGPCGLNGPGDQDFDIDAVLAACAHMATAVFTTPAVEHGFLETEACLAVPEGVGLHMYDQAQGICHNREDIAAVLNLPEEAIRVELADAGGAFGGKEDISVQAHAALAAHLLGAPVKVRLTRSESLRMHPKRHAMRLEYTLGCDAAGKLTALKARILADAGAYASVSAAVVTRTGTHAAGAYAVPFVDVRVQAVYTNNIPAGAFRGFGVNQSNFAMESMIDLLCAKGGFDRWQFRYDNALAPGLATTTGQILGEGVALRETLLAVKDAFQSHPRAGLACAIKNSGIGNGVPEPCDCLLEVTPAGGLVIRHAWTEMGQGLHTVARQIVCRALDLGPRAPVDVTSDTRPGVYAGSTTASRGTFQLGHALLDAARKLNAALGRAESPGMPLEPGDLLPLAGQSFAGHYDTQNRTSETGNNHLSYSFATHAAFLDENGRVERMVAAHDSGTVLNPALYASQVTGGVAMGLGYALKEALPVENARLTTTSWRACGLMRADDMPAVEVIAVEKPDPEGPLGAKGLGEICSIPATAAVINALAHFNGARCYDLPLAKKPLR